MTIEFKRLAEVSPADLIALMNHPRVRREMPPTKDNFDLADCERFIAAKEQLWANHGYGPWAFVVDGQFAGWGGLQPEGGDADLGLVLHPKYWGLGKRLYHEIIRQAFGEMGLASVTILFPPSRARIRGILRLGFVMDGELELYGERFIRYRLWAPQAIVIAEDESSLGGFLEARLLEDLRSALPQSENSMVLLSARNTNGSVVGGLIGSTSYGWLLIKVLWVDEAHRGRGLGKKLMARAEEKAREIGCHGAWLDTSNPGAMRFYTRLGYEVFGELSNTAAQHPSTHQRWFMKKGLQIKGR
jgi:GNAT superfamily N-acetyltransferase